MKKCIKEPRFRITLYSDLILQYQIMDYGKEITFSDIWEINVVEDAIEKEMKSCFLSSTNNVISESTVISNNTVNDTTNEIRSSAKTHIKPKKTIIDILNKRSKAIRKRLQNFKIPKKQKVNQFDDNSAISLMPDPEDFKIIFNYNTNYEKFKRGYLLDMNKLNNVLLPKK